MANTSKTPMTVAEYDTLLERVAVARLAIKTPARVPNAGAVAGELQVMRAEIMHDSNAFPRMADTKTATEFLTTWGIAVPALNKSLIAPVPESGMFAQSPDTANKG